MSDIPRSDNTSSQRNHFQKLGDTVFEQAFRRVLDVPVAPFREHAPDGVIDLGEAVELDIGLVTK